MSFLERLLGVGGGNAPQPQAQQMQQAQPMGQAPAMAPTARKGMFGIDFSDPQTAAALQMISNGLTPSVGAPRPMFQGVQQATASAMGMQEAKLTREREAKALQDESIKRNRSLGWIEQNAPEYLPLVEAGLFSASDVAKRVMGGDKDEFDQRADAARKHGLIDGTPEFQTYVLTGKLPTGGEGGDEWGLNTQYGVDEDGNPVLIQLSKSGKAQKTPLPEGVKLSKEPIKMDIGTHFVLLDPITRQPIGTIPKENRKEAFDKGLGGAEGKAAGEAAGSYRSIESKMPGLEAVVERLGELAETATYTYAGQGLDMARRQLGMDPREAAVARTEYQAMVDNQVLPMLRDTFGAAFTVKEGETLRATLGDLNKSPTERKAILRAFIEQKRRDLEALGRQSGAQGTAPAPSMGGSNRTRSGVTFTIEE